MTQGNLTRRLSPQDAFFLYFEKEEAPLHIGSVAVFQGEIPYDRFVKNLEDKLHLIPRYQQRVVPAPFNLNHPTWEFDPDFDIRNHIKLVRLDPPGGEEQLRDLAARLFQGTLSRDKPLWEIYLVHGIEGGRSALVSRVHHCLVDGVAGIELMMMILDVSPNPPPPPPPREAYSPPPIPDPISRLSDAFFDRLADGLRTGANLQKGLLDAIDNPGGSRSLARALETAFPYLARPGHRAPFNAPFSGERRLAWSDYSFQEVRAIRRAAGGTVNDVVLGMLGGALSRYYEAHGLTTQDQVARILTPVNVRREDEGGTLGNRVSMLLVEVPLDSHNPIDRLHIIQERTERLKRNHIADGIELVSGSLGTLPPMMQAFLGSMPAPPNTLANLVCTNVPGPMIPLYSVGYPLESHYPLVPITWEMGIGCAVTSYNQKLYFGLIADRGAAPDVDRLGDFLRQSYVELRSAAGIAPAEAHEVVAQPGRPARRAASAKGPGVAADAG